MIRKILLIIGAALAVAWGIAHLFPTISVVNSFGNITLDNSRVITMEWITEGMMLIFLGLLTVTVAIVENKGAGVAKTVYVLVFLMLVAMSILSLLTGFQINFLPYKLCPFIFTGSGLLILQGVMIK
jgi:hypothetical protein